MERGQPMNLLELQVLAVVSGIPDGNGMPSAQVVAPAPATSSSRTAAAAAPRTTSRPDPKPSV
jgi:hypothetical protein